MTELPLGSPDLEIAKAHRVLAAAEHLAAGGFSEDAVSRAYYAIFHAGCALLGSIGRTVRTHDGMRAAISQHFIRPGTLDPRFGRLLARTAADRNDADYNSAATFRPEDATDAIASAKEFVSAVDQVLATKPTP